VKERERVECAGNVYADVAGALVGPGGGFHLAVTDGPSQHSSYKSLLTFALPLFLHGSIALRQNNAMQAIIMHGDINKTAFSVPQSPTPRTVRQAAYPSPFPVFLLGIRTL
jgi:hypothetical protein